MRRMVLAAVFCLLLSACVTTNLQTASQPADTATPVYQAAPTPRRVRITSVTERKTTMSGATLRLASVQDLDPDCSARSTVLVGVPTPPMHGSVETKQGTAFSHYPPQNVRSACNALRTPATIVTYKADGGFVGVDVTTYRLSFADGNTLAVRAIITVD